MDTSQCKLEVHNNAVQKVLRSFCFMLAKVWLRTVLDSTPYGVGSQHCWQALVPWHTVATVLYDAHCSCCCGKSPCTGWKEEISA